MLTFNLTSHSDYFQAKNAPSSSAPVKFGLWVPPSLPADYTDISQDEYLGTLGDGQDYKQLFKRIEDIKRIDTPSTKRKLNQLIEDLMEPAALNAAERYFRDRLDDDKNFLDKAGTSLIGKILGLLSDKIFEMRDSEKKEKLVEALGKPGIHRILLRQTLEEIAKTSAGDKLLALAFQALGDPYSPAGQLLFLTLRSNPRYRAILREMGITL